jgi:carbon storage regulator CsrA
MIIERAAGESLRLNDEIYVTVINTRNGGVCLAIDAPPSIPIKPTSTAPQNENYLQPIAA